MARKKKVNYLSNSYLLEQIQESRKLKRCSDKLAASFLLLVSRLAKKPNFAGYSYNDDMQSAALINLVKVWDKFDEEKSDNPFSYYTQIAYQAMVHVIKHEKKHQIMRDRLLVDNGLDPSDSFALDHEISLREANSSSIVE